jgi:hypothetical protein
MGLPRAWSRFWTRRRQAALRSFLRVLAATALASYLELGVAPLDLRPEHATSIVNAVLAAAALTAFNAMRQGETRFGRGAESAGVEP